MKQKFDILILMTIYSMILHVFPEDIMSANDVRSAAKAVTPLDSVITETGNSHISMSHEKKSAAPLADEEVIDKFSPATGLLGITLVNQPGRKIYLETETKARFTFQYSFNCTDSKTHQLTVSIPHTKILYIVENGENKSYFECDTGYGNNSSMANHDLSYNSSINSSLVRENLDNQSPQTRQGYVNVTLMGGLIGVTHINFSVYTVGKGNENESIGDMPLLGLQKLKTANEDQQEGTPKNENLTLLETVSLEVSVIRSPKFIDTVFMVLVFIMEGIQLIALGSMVELEDFKKILKRPLATIVGLLCHYVVMTLVSPNFFSPF